MRVKIRGRLWNVVYKRLRGCYGECDDPATPGREIRIHDRLSEEEELETLIHEGIHAGLWDLSEETVTEVANDLARLIRRCGFRKADA